MKLKFLFTGSNTEIELDLNPFTKLDKAILTAQAKEKKLKSIEVHSVKLSGKDLGVKKSLMELGIKENSTITVDCTVNENTQPDPWDLAGVDESQDKNAIFIVLDVFDADKEDKVYKNQEGEVMHVDQKTTKKNIDQDIFFLCDKKISMFDKSYDLLDKDKCEIFIDGEKVEFEKSHKFDKPGKHLVKILLKEPLINMEYMFAYCNYITLIDLSHIDSSKLQNMNSAFNNCVNLEFLNIDKVKLPEISGLKFLFNGCFSLSNLKSNKENIKKLGMIYEFINTKVKLEKTD